MENNHLFIVTNPESDFCGEMFFVQVNSLPEAQKIAFNVYGEPAAYAGSFDDNDAEELGYDTY